MKYLYFISFALVYALVQLLEQINAVPFQWMSFYLTDLCAMPLVLGLLLLILRLTQHKYLRLPIWFILSITAYWTVYFEYYLPLQHSQYTADLLDGIMYFVGSLTFIFWQKNYQPSSPLKKQIQQT